MGSSQVYYNESDEFAALWLQELIRTGMIAPGIVDSRPIQQVKPTDLIGFTQCHFFAGIGVWSYALRLAGWPDSQPVWTGSCPCQPFSSASRGRGNGFDSDKHLWPFWQPLIAASRPNTLFGEQVASSKGWFDGVCDDLETLDYEVGAAVLPACGVGQDHARERLYFVGDTNGDRQPELSLNGKAPRVSRYRGDSAVVLQTNEPPYRVALLRGFGNALVADVAATFIQAYCEARSIA